MQGVGVIMSKFIPTIHANDLAPEHIRQAIIEQLRITPLAFEFNGKRQSFLSLRELTDRIELHSNYLSKLNAEQALGRTDLDSAIKRMESWLELANDVLADVQSKLASGIYREASHD